MPITSGKNKIENDKYYTNKDLAKRLINKTFEIIGKQNITEIIEPSAGNGAFSNQIEGCIAYDLYPDNNSSNNNIIQQDFLKLDIEYKSGRLIIGNPPFGYASSMARNFIKHSNQIAEYYAFILPSTFILNRQNLNILYSEHLKEIIFTNGKDKESNEYQERKVNCSKHIDKIKYPKYNFKDVKIWGIGRDKQNPILNNNYDFAMLCWGSGNDFATVSYKSDITNHSDKMFYYIKVNNESLKDIIYQHLLNFKQSVIQPRLNANLYCNAPSLTISELYSYLIQSIPELK